MNYFDSHCHLNDEAFQESLEEELSRCREAGLSALVCIGYDVASSRKAVDLANRYPEIYAAVGIHPENLEESVDCLKEIEELARHPKVVAIGEIGLDYYWYKDAETREKQKPWFIAQIDLANRLGLPCSIHAREASADTYAILKEHPIHAGAVLHCYSGSVEMMKEFAKLGYYFGFDGPITYKNSIVPKECVKLCPADRLLVETDSPYLSPVPFRGKPNSPKNIPLIVSAMAELRETDPETMNRQLWENFGKLFRVKHE